MTNSIQNISVRDVVHINRIRMAENSGRGLRKKAVKIFEQPKWENSCWNEKPGD